MPIRPIYGNSVEDLQSLVRDLNAELDRMRSGDNQGKRSANAAPAVQPADLVTKAQLDVVLDRVRRVEALPRRKRDYIPLTGNQVPGSDLPRATHYMDFGYYFGRTRYQEFKPFTMGYWAGAGEDRSELTPAEWIPLMAERVALAASDGKGITLEWEHGDGDTGANVLIACEQAGFDLVWPHVHHLLFADEPGVSRGTVEEWADDIRAQVRAYNLTAPDLGITLTRGQLLEGDLVNCVGVDRIGIECYIDAPGDPVSSVNVAALNDWIDQAKALVPASKKIYFIMQAYNRNGFWTNEQTLADLQVPVYLKSWDDPRVVEILMFAWDRYDPRPIPPGSGSKGSGELPLLVVQHKRIYAALTGQTVPQDGCIKQATGGNLEQYWADAYDLCIGEQIGILFELRDGVTYVIAGQEAAAKIALMEVLNRDQFNLVAQDALPVPPFNETHIWMKSRIDASFSETYSYMTSTNQIRFAGAYLVTCRPAQF